MPIGNRRQLGEQLADLHAGQHRGDRAKLAADFDRSLGLGIGEVDVRRPTVEVDIDQRLR